MAVINTNISAIKASNASNAANKMLGTAMERLSTGKRINSAKDDAAGSAIATNMTSQVRGMGQGIRNAYDGISLAQTAEGALGKVSDMAQRMRELAVQSANATNSDDDRLNLDEEYQQLALEITRTLGGTKFNEKNVLATAETLTFQVGAGTDAQDTIDVDITDLSADATITAVTSGAITDVATSTTAIDNIDDLLTTINTNRATFGAVQNRFEAAISTLQVAVENQTAARSRIMDADFASETAALTRAQVLQQAGTAMLSQANSIPNNVLTLLR